VASNTKSLHLHPTRYRGDGYRRNARHDGDPVARANPGPHRRGLVAYGVYVGDRISDVRYDPQATSERSAFIGRHRRLLSVTSAGAYGLAIALSTLGGPLALAITLVPGATWILYVVDLSERSFVPLKRLKTVLVLNSHLWR